MAKRRRTRKASFGILPLVSALPVLGVAALGAAAYFLTKPRPADEELPVVVGPSPVASTQTVTAPVVQTLPMAPTAAIMPAIMSGTFAPPPMRSGLILSNYKMMLRV